MARIRQDDVESVRERTDIVKLVQQYLGLKKAGRSFTGLCPFHPEKTPSFTVDPAKGVYYCFGCGKGGNAFHFVMEVEGLTFPEAVERLSREAGVTLRYEGLGKEDRRAMSRRQALYRANEGAAELYRRMLLEGREGEEARRYLQSRGISKEAAEAFRIGFAPGYPDFLLRRMTKEFPPEIMIEAGLALKDTSGRVRDRFRSRVTFPVNDLAGRTVGFGARLLEGEGPKYLNSPETPVYRKGEMLYNLDRAKASISSQGTAFVVEGYTDVIALDQGAVGVAVATCGTALTEGHFRLLSRFAGGGSVVLAFDSDEAGARAAERAYGLFEDHPIEVRVLIMPDGLDPADLVRERGAEAFQQLAGESLPLVEYMLRREVHRHDLASPEGRARATQAALPILTGLKTEVRRSQYAGRLADLTTQDSKAVLYELEGLLRSAGGGSPSAAPAKEQRRAPTRELEREALKLLAQEADMAREHASRITEEHFETEHFRRVFAFLGRERGNPAEIIERARDEGIDELVAALLVEPLTGDATEEYAVRVFARLEEQSLKRRIATMKKKLERLNPIPDQVAYDALFEELIALEARRRQVRARAGEGT